MLAAAALAVLGLSIGPALHPNSSSSSRVTVSGASVHVALRCQARSLIEALPIDRDASGGLDAAELDGARDALAAYVRDHYRIFDGGAEAPDPARALPCTLLAARLGERAPDTGEELVDLELEYRASAAPGELWLDVRLFFEQNPLHRDACSLEWNGEEQGSWLFPESGNPWHFEPAARRRPGVFGSYLKSGVEHILTGYDHIAFLIALALVAPSLWAVLGVITAFTAAHSVTLALAALGLVHVRSSWVEMAIALSIAYVAALNLLVRRPAARWVEAFMFGLIHGLGFAGFLADALIFEPLKTTALIAFNLGVECGQLTVVALLATALIALPGDRAFGGAARAFLAPRWARTGGSAVICVLGLLWFAQRAGWLTLPG